uniref:Uncharacterized protein n=1 Tax=Oryza meridionalis TaxID=40149 RepID=A0A0E0F5E2_9ORYZ
MAWLHHGPAVLVGYHDGDASGKPDLGIGGFMLKSVHGTQVTTMGMVAARAMQELWNGSDAEQKRTYPPDLLAGEGGDSDCGVHHRSRLPLPSPVSWKRGEGRKRKKKERRVIWSKIYCKCISVAYHEYV